MSVGPKTLPRLCEVIWFSLELSATLRDNTEIKFKNEPAKEQHDLLIFVRPFSPPKKINHTPNNCQKL